MAQDNLGRGVTRRGFLTVAVSAIVAGVVAGVGAYYAGTLSAPVKEVTKTLTERETVTRTVTTTLAPGAPLTTTVTTTITQPPTTTTVTATTTATTTTTVTAAKPAPDYILLGIMGPMTGPSAEWGRDELDGANLAVEKINREGGVYVREFGKKIPIKLVVGDDKNVPAEGVTVVKRLITAEKVHGLLGTISSAVMFAVQPTIVEAGLPYIFIGTSILCTTRTDIDTSNTFHYMATPQAHQIATAMFLTKVFKPKLKLDRKVRLAMLIQDTVMGHGNREAMEMLLKTNPEVAKDLELVTYVPYPIGETMYHSYLLKIKDAKPDAVYVAGLINEASAAIIQGLRDVKLNTLYIAEPCNEDMGYYKIMGKWGDRQCLVGIALTTVKPPPSDIHAKFAEEFEKRYGYSPGLFACAAHDCVFIYKDAIERVGSLDPKAIIAGLHAVNLPLLSGMMVKGGRIRFWDIGFDAAWNSSIPRSIFIEDAILQQYWDEAAGYAKPYIVYHPTLKAQKEFELPPGYTTYY
jgi:branched-chain amino acid transport system substrate-binding protein